MVADRKEYITLDEAFVTLIDLLAETAELSLEIACNSPADMADPLSEASRHQRIAALNTEFIARVAILRDDYARRLLITLNPHFEKEGTTFINQMIESQRRPKNSQST